MLNYRVHAAVQQFRRLQTYLRCRNIKPSQRLRSLHRGCYSTLGGRVLDTVTMGKTTDVISGEQVAAKHVCIATETWRSLAGLVSPIEPGGPQNSAPTRAKDSIQSMLCGGSWMGRALRKKDTGLEYITCIGFLGLEKRSMVEHAQRLAYGPR